MLYLNTPHLKGNEKKYLSEVIDSTWLARGDFNKRFEKEFAKFCKQEAAQTVTSGTVAVTILLKAAGVKKVAVPAYTCMSVAQAVHHSGAIPVFVDIEEDTLGIDFKSLNRMYQKTKFDAVLLNHLYGFIARDTEKIQKFCKLHRIQLLEDASEAHGAKSKLGIAGELGDGAAFSLRSEKMIGVGEGGVIVGPKKLIEKVYYWINDARPSDTVRYYTTAAGYNFFMPNALGAIALAQFEQIEKIIRLKRKVASWYAPHFKKRWYLKPLKKSAGDKPVYWLNVAIISEKLYIHREDLISMLKEKGIETRPGFYPLNKLPAYRHYPTDKTPVADLVGRRGIAFPSNTFLTKKDVAEVFEKLDECLG